MKIESAALLERLSSLLIKIHLSLSYRFTSFLLLLNKLNNNNIKYII